jgi:hypothetical protein
METYSYYTWQNSIPSVWSSPPSRTVFSTLILDDEVFTGVGRDVIEVLGALVLASVFGRFRLVGVGSSKSPSAGRGFLYPR